MVANLFSGGGFIPPVPMKREDLRMYQTFPRRPVQAPTAAQPAPAPVVAPQPAPQPAPVTLNSVPAFGSIPMGGGPGVARAAMPRPQFPMGGGPGAAPHRAGYDPDVQKMIDSLIQQGASPYGPFTGVRRVVRDPRDQQSSLGAGNGLLALLSQLGVA